MEIKMLLYILLTGVFVNNYVLQRFLGICPFLGVSKKLNQAVGMGFAVTFVLVCATLVTWPLQHYVLDPWKLGYLQTIAFILVIAALVQFVEVALKKLVPSLHKSLGVYLPLITTNCAVLGAAINNITDGFNLVESLFSSVGVGVGFLLSMVLFAGVRSRIENSSSAPESFKGLPITLVAASIVSLAFFGFAGVVEGLLGIG